MTRAEGFFYEYVDVESGGIFLKENTKFIINQDSQFAHFCGIMFNGTLCFTITRSFKKENKNKFTPDQKPAYDPKPYSDDGQ